MTLFDLKNPFIITENQTLQDLGTLLQRCLLSFNNFVLEYRDQQAQLEDYKNRYLALKQKCEIKKFESCIDYCPSEDMKNHITESTGLMCSRPQNLETATTKNDSKGSVEKKTSKGSVEKKTSVIPFNDSINDLKFSQTISIEKICRKEEISPTKDIQISDQSNSDVEETLTGRRSPIFSFKNKVSKKKLSNSWQTPESKVVKLSIPSSSKRNKPGGKLKQARFNFVQPKTSQIIDASNYSITAEHRPDIANSVKVEQIEHDDTIFPSPTSHTIKFQFVSRNLKKENPNNFYKSKPMPNHVQNDLNYVMKDMENPNYIIDANNMKTEDETVNLLHLENLKHTDTVKNCMEYDLHHKTDSNTSPLKHSEKIVEKHKPDLEAGTEKSLQKQSENGMPLMENINCDSIQTQCDTDISVSVIKPVGHDRTSKSENKMPLMENINCDNIQTQCDTNTSVSLLKPVGHDRASKRNCVSVVKKENVEHLYKEPAPRKKAEKKALPGWNCDRCKNFYGTLHKDDLVMLEKRMLECSKHRGKTNPLPLQTQPGLWEPRWRVEDDTEIFNKHNDVT